MTALHADSWGWVGLAFFVALFVAIVWDYTRSPTWRPSLPKGATFWLVWALSMVAIGAMRVFL